MVLVLSNYCNACWQEKSLNIPVKPESSLAEKSETLRIFGRDLLKVFKETLRSSLKERLRVGCLLLRLLLLVVVAFAFFLRSASAEAT